MLLRVDSKSKPLLIVPSLVNRFHVLDTSPGRSFLDHLNRAGFAPYVLDWDRPGNIERDFTLTDYVAGRLEQTLDVVLQQTGQKPEIIDYCMGGLLAPALAQRRQAGLRSLVLLATPWGFSTDARHALTMLATMKPSLGGIMDMLGELPTDIIQSMFYVQDSMLVPRKFLHFAKMDMKSAVAKAFVALEDWIDDRVPLAALVAHEALFGWYGENAPAKGTQRTAGRVVTPKAVTLPGLSLTSAPDRIVPLASAVLALPDSTKLRTALGHIGMVVSENAQEPAWDAIVNWLERKS